MCSNRPQESVLKNLLASLNKTWANFMRRGPSLGRYYCYSSERSQSISQKIGQLSVLTMAISPNQRECWQARIEARRKHRSRANCGFELAQVSLDSPGENENLIW